MLKVPKDEQAITEMAEESCEALLTAHTRPYTANELELLSSSAKNEEGRLPTTNEPLIFRDVYTKNFIDGYRFGLYASLKGLLDVLVSIPADRRYEASFLFSWNMFHPDEQEDIPTELQSAVKGIERLYQKFNQR